MAEIIPQFLDAEAYIGKKDRQHWRDILTEGVVETDDLKVQEKGTPDMSVDVLIGKAYVQGDQSAIQGHYRIYNDATVNKSIAASDPTNPRKDRVIAQVKDSTDIGGALNEWELQILTGTPAASPVVPDLPDDALDLAIINVGAGVTEILNANITDQRSQIELQNVTTKSWTPTGEAWAYAGWDDPTGTITVPSGAANKYGLGMKIKITQATGGTKYGIITKIADTTLTVYFGTDYTLNNEAITLPYYSTMKAPQGFPLNPAKWTVEVTDVTERTQENPVQNTWYNLGSISINIPLGIWDVSYNVCFGSYDVAATSLVIKCTLSTANNSESDVDFTSYSFYQGASADIGMKVPAYKAKILNLSSKDTYYLNTAAILTGIFLLYNANGYHKLIIRAICAYL